VREEEADLHRGLQPAKFNPVAAERPRNRSGHGARLILENSTVCHSRRISLLCPVLAVVCGSWLSGFFGNDNFDNFCRGSSLLGISFSAPALFVGVGVVLFFNGEFDPGSGRTLAACLTHASRAVRPLRGYTSGERVSNT
jgi:hypothetical protein